VIVLLEVVKPFSFRKSVTAEYPARYFSVMGLHPVVGR
jgi:hypothetical protein